MKSRSLRISEILFVVLILTIILYFDSYMEKEIGYVFASSIAMENLKTNDTSNNSTKSPLILINTTNISNCFSPTLNDPNNLDFFKKPFKNPEGNGLENRVFENVDINNSSKFCKVYTVSEPSTCIVYFVNHSKKSCQIDDEDEDKIIRNRQL